MPKDMNGLRMLDNSLMYTAIAVNQYIMKDVKQKDSRMQKTYVVMN